MTEKIEIKGKEIWITVEPHIFSKGKEPRERFTASYHLVDPGTDPSGILFVDNEKTPLIFESPVAALEYASEKLLDLTD